MTWTILIERASQFDAALLNVAFVFLLLGYGTKVGLAPGPRLAARCPCRGPDADLRGAVRLLLNVALYAVLRFKMLMSANEARWRPGR
jgi:hydrogenase-4 component F